MSLTTPELAEVSSSTSRSTSRSTDCIDLESGVCSGEAGDLCPSPPTPSLRSNTEKMRKYHGVIKLLNSSNSNSDLSTLDLATMAETRPAMEMVLDMSTTSGDSSYYTIDSRRLASKHKKTQQDR